MPERADHQTSEQPASGDHYWITGGILLLVVSLMSIRTGYRVQTTAPPSVVWGYLLTGLVGCLIGLGLLAGLRTARWVALTWVVLSAVSLVARAGLAKNAPTTAKALLYATAAGLV